jgi:hypothetical protein
MRLLNGSSKQQAAVAVMGLWSVTTVLVASCSSPPELRFFLCVKFRELCEDPGSSSNSSSSSLYADWLLQCAMQRAAKHCAAASVQ